MLLLPDVLVAALATWRLTHMLLYENGPFRLLRRGREMLGVIYYDPDSNEVASAKYEITTCIWCMSVWVGAVLSVLWLLVPLVAFWVAMPFALSAMAVLVQKVAKP